MNFKNIFIVSFLICFLFIGCKKNGSNDKLTYPYTVFVSILPQKYFIKQIAKEKVNVIAMVRPGQSPATYEPTPRQITLLSKARLYFKIGVPFEKVWIDKIRNANSNLTIIDTAKNIRLRQIETFKKFINNSNTSTTETHNHSDAQETNEHEHEHGHEHEHSHSGNDPHIWLSPKLVKKQLKTILQAFVHFDKKNKKYYQTNYNEFISKLDNLISKVNGVKNKLKQKQVLVFHPAWGYLCDDLGLKQIPIEFQGNKPSARELNEIIKYAKLHKIKYIFVQKQFSTREAEIIAKQINAEVIALNPLSENWFENMNKIVDIIYEKLKGSGVG